MNEPKGLNSLLENHYTFVSATAKRYGVSSSMLANAVKTGRVSREARGVYVETGYTWDVFAILSQRYTKGIFALETALFLHGLTDLIPRQFIMGFPNGYNNVRLEQQHVKPIYYVSNRYLPGIVSVMTPNRNKVRTYSVERTVLEIWQRPDIAPYTRNEVFKNYLDEYKQNYESFQRLQKLKNQLYPNSDLIKMMEVFA